MTAVLPDNRVTTRQSDSVPGSAADAIAEKATAPGLPPGPLRGEIRQSISDGSGVA